jgi:hypothetical protein
MMKRPSSSSEKASSIPPSAFPTVESFSLSLKGLEHALHAPSPTRWLEAQLLSRLDRPIRLLRWAIVDVKQSQKVSASGQRFRCEGSYLRRPTMEHVSNN